MFFAEVHCMKYKIRWENNNFHDMDTLRRCIQCSFGPKDDEKAAFSWINECTHPLNDPRKLLARCKGETGLEACLGSGLSNSSA